MRKFTGMQISYMQQNFEKCVSTDPEIDRRSPESIPGDGPVTRVLQPVGEALLLDKRRHPGNNWDVVDVGKIRPGRRLVG